MIRTWVAAAVALLISANSPAWASVEPKKAQPDRTTKSKSPESMKKEVLEAKEKLDDNQAKVQFSTEGPPPSTSTRTSAETPVGSITPNSSARVEQPRAKAPVPVQPESEAGEDPPPE